MRAAWTLLLLATAFAAPADGAPPRIAQLDAADLSPELRPAADFQNVFVKIVEGDPQTAWLQDLERVSLGENGTNVERGVRDLARVWLARVRMQRIDAALRDYYVDNIRFPDSLDELNLPEDLRLDPWGEKWAYRLVAPRQFPGMAEQRYQLGPARFPQLTPFAEAVGARPPLPGWKVSERGIGGKKAVELFNGSSQAPAATLEEGGTAANCTLLYIGQNWALMANSDQLFAVAF